MNKLERLKKSISDMSDDELKAHVISMRTKTYITRPAKKKHDGAATKKKAATTTKKVSKLGEEMSADQKAALLASLGLGGKV